MNRTEAEKSNYQSLLRTLNLEKVNPSLKKRITQALRFAEGGGDVSSWMKELTPKLAAVSGKTEREVYDPLLRYFNRPPAK